MGTFLVSLVPYLQYGRGTRRDLWQQNLGLRRGMRKFGFLDPVLQRGALGAALRSRLQAGFVGGPRRLLNQMASKSNRWLWIQDASGHMPSLQFSKISEVSERLRSSGTPLCTSMNHGKRLVLVFSSGVPPAKMSLNERSPCSLCQMVVAFFGGGSHQLEPPKMSGRRG